MMDVSSKPVLWIVLDDFVSYAEQQQPVRMTMGGHRRHGSLSDMLSSTSTPSHHPRLDVATHGMQKLTITQPAAPIEPRLDESSSLLTPPPPIIINNEHHQEIHICDHFLISLIHIQMDPLFLHHPVTIIIIDEPFQPIHWISYFNTHDMIVQ